VGRAFSPPPAFEPASGAEQKLGCSLKGRPTLSLTINQASMRDFRAIDDNLRIAMRFFGEATGSGEIRVVEGAQMVYSGLDYGVFNIGFLDGVAATEQSLGSVLATCGRFYKERCARWSFWLCESLLDGSVRRRSRDIFAEA
jgi:hypothetical protein